MARSVKGNRKGSIRSYQFRRFLFMAGMKAMVFVLLGALLLSNRMENTGNIRKGSIFSHAAEVLVSENGNVVMEVS